MLRPDPTTADPIGTHVWTIDARRASGWRQRCAASTSRRSPTIDAFCQRVLTEHAFASGRLLAQNPVESRTAFTAAFDEVIRSRIEGEPAIHCSQLAADGERRRRAGSTPLQGPWLRCEWSVTFDTRTLARAARGARGDRPGKDELAAVRAIGNKRTSKAAGEPARRATRGGDPLRRARPSGLAAGRRREPVPRYAKKDLFGYCTASTALGPVTREAGRRARCSGTSRSSPTRRSRWRPRSPSASGRSSRIGCARASAPPACSTSTTCCRWSSEALRGPRGGELAATLRARYRLAVIDEFQDTDPVQWEIFRTIFLDGRRRAAALPGRRSEAGDLRLPRRRRQHLRRARATRVVDGTGGVHHLRAELPLDPRGHRHLQRDLRSEGEGAVLLTGMTLRPPGHLRRQGERAASISTRRSRCCACRRRTRRSCRCASVRDAARAGDRRRDRRSPGRGDVHHARERSSS